MGSCINYATPCIGAPVIATSVSAGVTDPYIDLLVYTIILIKSACLSISKLQVAILARSSREMSQTVRIDYRSFLSRVRISVRPSNFFYAKNTHKLSRKPSLAQVPVE